MISKETNQQFSVGMDDMLETDKAAFTSNIISQLRSGSGSPPRPCGRNGSCICSTYVPLDFFNSGLSPERSMLAGHDNCKLSLISLMRKDFRSCVRVEVAVLGCPS